MADAVLAAFGQFDPHELHRIVQAGMEDVGAADLTSAPEGVARSFGSTRVVPESAAMADFGPGIRLLHRNSQLVLGAMEGGTLTLGFATNISKPFFITSHPRDSRIRRLLQHT